MMRKYLLHPQQLPLAGSKLRSPESPMNKNPDLAEQYFVLIKNLAFLSANGAEVTENLFFTLESARRAFSTVGHLQTARCIDALMAAMQDESLDEFAVVYNAVLNWAIRDLREEIDR